MYWTTFKLIFLLLTYVSAQDVLIPNQKVQICDFCTCSEIYNDEGTYVVLNILCSELDKLEKIPDLDKISLPENPHGLKITVAFEGLELPTLGKFPQNPQVESIRFYNNAIKTYWPDPFSDVPNLKKLSLSQSDLTLVTPDLFTKLDNLQELDLSYNKLSDFNPLDFKSLTKVERFSLQSNDLKKIPVDALLPMIALRDLDLSKNGILDLVDRNQKGARIFKGLRSLNLSGNRIRSVTKESFPEDNSLEILDLSNNVIENIDEDAFSSCYNLRELNVAQNNITVVFTVPPNLQVGIFKQNTLHRWPKFPNSIISVDLSYNLITEMYTESNADFENLEILNIAGNQLKELSMTKKLPKLSTLDISYNYLEEIPKSLTSITLPSLEELRLDGNPLTSIYFKNILALKTLYMNELGKLSIVEDKAFSNIMGRKDSDCFSLQMSSCHSLSEIQDGAFDGISLCKLDISNNNLTRLSKNLIDWSQVKEGVDMQWNPWDCNCDFQWVLTDLLPSMYEKHPRLLTQLRCGSPRAVQGLRLVHWYNWTGQVLCREDFFDRSGSYLLESRSGDRPFMSNVSYLTIILGSAVIVCLFIALGLTVYLIKSRRRYRVRQAALKRKRQSAIDARNSNGDQKEQYSALNKV